MNVWSSRRRLSGDRSGNVTLLFAGAMGILTATAALGVDAGAAFLGQRRLQGIADAAALAAAGDVAGGQTAANAAIAANKASDVTLRTWTTGRYSADTTIAANARFVAGAPSSNAARVVVQGSVPTFFSRVFTGQASVPITAQATAARIDLAAFSIGSRLAAVQGGLPNALLSGLAGTDLGLSVMDYNALVSGRVDIMRFCDALRSRLGLDVATFGETLNSRVTLPQVAAALASSATDSASAAALRSIAGRLPTTTITPATAIDLGPLQSSVRVDPLKPVEVDALSALRAVLEVGGGAHQVSADVDIGVPGVASSTVTLAMGERPAHSPWLSINAKGDLKVRTVQTRLYIDTRLAGAPLLGISALRVPFYVDLAEAEASLSDVSCSRGRANATATLGVVPSVGRVSIADIDRNTLMNFQNTLDMRPASVASLPLLSITAFADLALGGVSSQSVVFSATDISQHLTKTVSTNDIVAGVASSLLSRMDLRVNVVGLGLNASLITSTVGGILRQAAGPLDSLIDQVTGLAGVRVGQADVQVNGVRCGTPMLVA